MVVKKLKNKLEIMEKSFRQTLLDLIDNLNNDFRLLWGLRHNNSLYDPLLLILYKLRGLKELLKFHPEIRCSKCNHIQN